MKAILVAAALLGVTAMTAPAAAIDTLSAYRFTGACDGCGQAVATLVLRNYDPAADPDLTQANFVSFRYASDDIAALTVSAVDNLSGSLASVPGTASVAFQATGSDLVFQSFGPDAGPLDGFWSFGGSVGEDLGFSHLWVATAVPSAVPEPAGWATIALGFALAGTALRARRRPDVRFA